MPERSDFWSRRRRAVAAEETRVERLSTEAEAEAKATALEDRSDAEILESLGLPDPEALTPADAARFMAREIPARLRRRAIRHLFRAHPHLSMPDGLQDYDDDYTDAAVNLRPDPAAWDGLRRRAERLAQAAADRPESEDAAAGGTAAHGPAGESDGADATAPAGPTPAPLADTEHRPDPGTAAGSNADTDTLAEAADGSPRPRRMTFQFEEDFR